MKSNPIILACSFMLLLLAAVPAFAQTGNQPLSKEAKTKNLVQSGDYTFVARQALPMRGQTRSLTSEYDLHVSADTIEAYLPYFGRAYSAPVDPSKGGIQFTSTRFKSTVTEGKKGGWTVSIVPDDARDVRQLTLTISSTGYASLHVLSNNRQAISFHGYIDGKKD